MKGYGSILRVDLTTSAVSHDPITAELARQYLGGGGINDRLLWDHFLKLDPRIDPCSPDNVLIAGLGPLGATGLGLGSKMKWTFKSPMTGIFGDSVSGGNLATQLRWAGHDHLVITGRAAQPVYLRIDNDRVEIRDARHLWGKRVSECMAVLRHEVGDEEVGIACIGPAGENLVAFASITVADDRSAGRMGAGCVAGSKNLKAIVARGDRGVPIHDPQAFVEVTREIFQAMEEPVFGDFKRSGTRSVVEVYHRIGSNAYHNNMYGTVPDEKIARMNAHWFDRRMKTHDLACSAGCTIACDTWCRVRGDEGAPSALRFAGHQGHAPEYLSVAVFGMNCDLPDYPAITYLQHLCNELGMDIQDGGSIPSFLMELWGRGLITQRETTRWAGRPLRFDWGNMESVEETLRSIAYQDNRLGQMFRRGAYRATEELERELEPDHSLRRYVVHGKGGATFHEENRRFLSWALCMAVSTRGCDHLKGGQQVEKAFREDISQAWFGDPGAGRGGVPDLKGPLVAYSEHRKAAFDASGVCFFSRRIGPLVASLDLLARACQAATGLTLTGEDLYRVGERIYNLEKAFNSRLGLRRADDSLCDRWMHEPVPEEPGKGMKAADYFDQILSEYYAFHGWDPGTSLQTRQKLRELELEDVEEVLAREGAVA